MLTNPKWDYLKWVVLAALIFVTYFWWFRPPPDSSELNTKLWQFFSAFCVGFYLALFTIKAKTKDAQVGEEETEP